MSTISFLQIATNEKIPGYYGEISTVNANQGVFDYPTKILCIGPMLNTGTADPLSKNIIVDPKQAAALFGPGAVLTLMCAAILEVQDTIELWAIPQEDDAASATAAGSILVDNVATSNGTLYLYIAGEQIKVGVSTTDSKAEIAANIVEAINEETSLPATAAINGGTAEQIDLTSRNAGLVGNEITISTNYYTGEQLPAGFALTITAFSGGTSNPDIEDVIDAIEADWFTDMTMPYTDASNLAAFETELKARYSATGKQDAHLVLSTRGSFSENFTFCDGRNSALVSNMPIPSDALDPAYIWAAKIVGLLAFGSNQHPARPFKGFVLTGLKPPKTTYTETERRAFLSNGGSTWNVNVNGEVILERLVTMYQANEAGIEDETFLDVTTPKTFSHIRYDDNAYITTLYFGAEGKVLTENEQAAARSDILVTPKTIDASSRGRAELWIDNGWVSEVVEIRSEVDGNDPTRVNRLMSLDITNPLMILATKLDMRL